MTRLSVMRMLKKIIMGETAVVVDSDGGFVVLADFFVGVLVRLARYCSRYSFPRRCIDGIRVMDVVSSDRRVEFGSVVSSEEFSTGISAAGGSAAATVVLDRVDS